MPTDTLEVVARPPSLPLTDSELVAEAKRGRDAVAALIKRHTPMVYKLVHDMHLPPQVDRDDLVQHGLLALERAAYKWEEGKGSKFSSYAWQCVFNAIRREAGVETHKTASLNNPLADDGGELLDLIPAAQMPELPVDVRGRVDGLPPLLKKVVVLAYGLDGKPVRWGLVADAVGLTVLQAKRALEMALARLREDGPEDDT